MVVCLHSGESLMKSVGWFVMAVLMFSDVIAARAVEPTPPRSTLTQPFGSGTPHTDQPGRKSR
jgi:hypothetical protein